MYWGNAGPTVCWRLMPSFSTSCGDIWTYFCRFRCTTGWATTVSESDLISFGGVIVTPSRQVMIWQSSERVARLLRILRTGARDVSFECLRRTGSRYNWWRSHVSLHCIRIPTPFHRYKRLRRRSRNPSTICPSANMCIL